MRVEIESMRLSARLVSDPTSALRFRKLLLARRGVTDAVPRGGTVEIRLRGLRGSSVRLRPGSADVQTVVDVFRDGEHLPPPPLGPPDLILDLGANVGLTMAHFATLFPSAQIVGAELDPENAELCRQNVAAWAGRCQVIAAGIWTADGPVAYVRREGREVSHAITAGASDATAAAQAISLGSLLNSVTSGLVDYVKMDIEGAERDVLRDGLSWAGRVRSIRVEVHPPYTVAECAADLARLGFVTSTEERRCAYVIGMRL